MSAVVVLKSGITVRLGMAGRVRSAEFHDGFTGGGVGLVFEGQFEDEWREVARFWGDEVAGYVLNITPGIEKP
jgi:hypothetical protein